MNTKPTEPTANSLGHAAIDQGAKEKAMVMMKYYLTDCEYVPGTEVRTDSKCNSSASASITKMTHDIKPILQISRTAQQYGYGCDQYKKVTFLTAEERAKVRGDERIFFRADRVSAKGQNGTFWRVAKVFGQSIGPRVPTPDEVASLRVQTGLK